MQRFYDAASDQYESKTVGRNMPASVAANSRKIKADRLADAKAKLPAKRQHNAQARG